eukprot:gene7120-6421_t
MGHPVFANAPYLYLTNAVFCTIAVTLVGVWWSKDFCHSDDHPEHEDNLKRKFKLSYGFFVPIFLA